MAKEIIYLDVSIGINTNGGYTCPTGKVAKVQVIELYTAGTTTLTVGFTSNTTLTSGSLSALPQDIANCVTGFISNTTRAMPDTVYLVQGGAIKAVTGTTGSSAKIRLLIVEEDIGVQ